MKRKYTATTETMEPSTTKALRPPGNRPLVRSDRKPMAGSVKASNTRQIRMMLASSASFTPKCWV